MRKILLPPLVMLLCILGTIGVERFGPDFFGFGIFWHGNEWDPLGYILIAIGIALPIWGSQTFKRHETNILPYKDPDHLVTDGPFRFTRNPMYLGMVLVITAVAIFTATTVGFAFPVLFFSIANWWYIPFEEERMSAMFGGKFDAYKKRVRRWI